MLVRACLEIVLLAITAYPTGIVLFIPSLPATDKDAGGLPVLQQASVPRQRLRSIPCRSKSAKVVLARLEARQQLERVLALDGALIGGREAPVRDAPVDLRAIAEGIVGAVEHLRDRHHFQQRRDLARRVALRQLVIEFPELGQRTVGQVWLLALLGEADETAGQERQRAATVGEDPTNVRKPRGGAAEHDVRDGARGVGRVFARCRRDAWNEAAAAIGRGRVDIDHGLAPIELLVDRGKRRIAEILVLVTGQQADAVGVERVEGVLDLLEAALRVRRRDDGKKTEAA